MVWAGWLISAWLGCPQGWSEPAVPVPMHELLQPLRESDAEATAAALDALSGRADRGLPREDALTVLEQVPGHRPAVQVPLIRAVARHPTVGLVPAAVDAYGKVGGTAQVELLTLLSAVPEVEGARAFMHLVGAQFDAGAPPALDLTRLARAPRHADVYFPALLDLAEPPNERSVLELCLAFFDKRMLMRVDPTPYRDLALERFLPVWRSVTASPRPDSYEADREWAVLLLELLTHVPDQRVELLLRDALTWPDAQVQLVALAGLLRLGLSVSREHVAVLAEDPAARDALRELLASRGQLGLLPPEAR